MTLPTALPGYLLYMIFVCLFIAIGSCFFFLRELLSSGKKFKSEEEKTLKQYNEVLLKAHTDAEKILSDAAAAETQIGQHTMEMEQKVIETARISAQETITKLASQYETNASLLDASLQKQSEALFTRVEASAEQHIQAFMDAFARQTGSLQATLTQQSKEAFANIDRELQEFKTQQEQKITEQARDMVVQVSSEVLRRSISPEEHEELLLEALEKAKKEGLLRI